MRVYGRPLLRYSVDGRPVYGPWEIVETDAGGQNDAVMLTALCQALKLNVNESPFYGTWGIPSRDSVMQQVAPDLYVTLTQQRFSSQFANLIIARTNATPTPTYKVNVITHYGAKLDASVPAPQ